MTKFRYVLAMMASMLVGCHSCHQSSFSPLLPADSDAMSSEVDSDNSETSPTIVDVGEKTAVFSSSDYQLEIPISFSHQEAKADTKIKLVMEDKEDNIILFLLKEPYNSTYDNYTLLGIKGIQATGGDLKSVTTVLIHNQTYLLSNFLQKKAVIWSWQTVKAGYGWGFSCGGPASNLDKTRKVCFEVMDTLVLK